VAPDLEAVTQLFPLFFFRFLAAIFFSCILRSSKIFRDFSRLDRGVKSRLWFLPPRPPFNYPPFLPKEQRSDRRRPCLPRIRSDRTPRFFFVSFLWPFFFPFVTLLYFSSLFRRDERAVGSLFFELFVLTFFSGLTANGADGDGNRGRLLSFFWVFFFSLHRGRGSF